MFLPLFLSLPVLAGDPVGEAPLVLRTYELSGVLPRSTRFVGRMGFFPTLLPIESEQDPNWQETEPSAPEMLFNLIQPQFPGEFEAAGCVLSSSDGHRLVVRAAEDVHQGVLKLLQTVESLFATSGELLVDVVRSPNTTAGGPPCLVSVAEAEKLLASAGGERASYRMEVRPGVPNLLDLTGTQQIVGDYNVEIAQAATILDPVVIRVPTGMRLQACCAPAPGGTWIALLLQGSEPVAPPRDVPFATSGQITTQNEILRSAGPRTLQSACVENRSLAVNVFLGEGKALVLRTGIDLADKKGQTWIVVRAGSKPLARDFKVGPIGKPGAPEVRAFQFAQARPPVVRAGEGGMLTQPWTGLAIPVMMGNLSASGLMVEFVHAQPDEVLDLLRTENGALDLSTWGPWVFASHLSESGPAKPGELDAVDAALARLAPSTRMFQLDVTLRRGGEKGAIVAHAVLAARAGEPVIAVLGTEQNRVADYDVEVAQSASASDPTVEDSFEGLALDALPAPGLSGETRLALRARARVQRGSPREYQTGSTQLDFDQLTLDERLSFPKEGPRVVRLGDTGGGSNGLLLEVELVELR